MTLDTSQGIVWSRRALGGHKEEYGRDRVREGEEKQREKSQLHKTEILGRSSGTHSDKGSAGLAWKEEGRRKGGQ